ncbi:MAG: saccharopine dehydrogenase NADP-binding domain-containing protein, partial [Phocaeicola sp.]|nr:saccharopine dehydrogenase NADP-binding domain-containing protein [Phocaeicola sp.]
MNGNVCRAFYFNKNKKQQMGKVLIIGAGGVGTVVAHKVAQNPDVFTDIMIAS